MTLSAPLFIVASAGCYAAAMIAMKLWHHAPGGPPALALGLVIALTLVAAAVLEVSALRFERLGMVYVGILGAEVVVIAAASWLLFGESFSAREIAGAGLVIVGTALAWA